MKEIISSYEDLERRMAVYFGLGAFLIASFYLFMHGADTLTVLIRGLFAMAVATIAGWAYGHYLAALLAVEAAKKRMTEEAEFLASAPGFKALAGKPDSNTDALFAPPSAGQEMPAAKER